MFSTFFARLGALQFSEITMQSLKVSWDAPKKRNGEILGYIVTYETTKENDSKLTCRLGIE